MNTIEIKPVKNVKDLQQFVAFPNILYKGDPHYVPVIVEDGIVTLSSKHNPIIKDCKTAYWMAFRDGKMVGRIAGIINNEFIYKWGKRYARFGWMDFIDDPRVAAKLFETVENWAIQNGMEAINGPLGFTDLDTSGLLIKGFEYKATILGRYNYPYYQKYIEDLGYRKDADWIEYQIDIPDAMPRKLEQIAHYVTQRHNLIPHTFKNINEAFPYVNQIFDIVNQIYGLVYGYVPITKEIGDFYISRYKYLLDPELISIITDRADKVIAFGVAMPSYSDVFIKSKGNMLRLKWLLFKGEHKKTDTVDMYYIGVRPGYIRKGISSVLMYEIGEKIIERGYRYAESNFEYESNFAVRSLWRHFSHRQHKCRRCYQKYFLSSTRSEDSI
ncbi:MAG TPA: N-acetyltransferase [Bacteroidales bacterium]|jgi:GNAT superfamily N-acetyltransferase|nr:N-acetyltransferase [Bacteroidales bacterium]MDI9573464.1 hypothetical protein [Bacteroidota bacterium]OQC61895.1 MAG: hypothetical protein BWX51_00036 [Bacteroidetes bacterium ADurb.Bin012]MBP9511267.1 N-acetyltransferase [Bacteroidales bacterium]MBP9587688.1 N-acetyltransferase [Bacteroidales bacterium]